MENSNHKKFFIMAGKKSVQTQTNSIKIMEKLLGELTKSRPIFLGDIHQNIYKFAQKNNFDANRVGEIVKKIMLETFNETFAQDFSQKPKYRGHHGGH